MTWKLLQIPPPIICAIRGHVPMFAQGRWCCFRCLRDLGATVLRFDTSRRSARPGDREAWR